MSEKIGRYPDSLIERAGRSGNSLQGKIHESITTDRVVALVKRRQDTLDDPGICLYCGTECYEGVESDAEGYPCEHCGMNYVMGCDALLERLVA